MLAHLLARLEKVHRAATHRELEAIYRFRYTVYVEELGREIGGADHDNRWVRDSEDDKPWSHHFYVGGTNEITGTIRLRVWEPGQVPRKEFETLSLDLLPSIERYRIAELGRFMIHPARRGSLILPSMARASYEFLAGQAEVDLCFCYCRPGLVKYYRRLGTRPYTGRMVEAPEGLEVPLMSVLSDRAYYREVGCPMAPLVKKFFGPGKRPVVDISPFAHAFEADSQPVITDGDGVWGAMQDALLDDLEQPVMFLDRLSEKAVQRLSRSGFIMNLKPGSILTREGHKERELYIILGGEFEVVKNDEVLARLGPGEVVGEMAFFRESGERSASVRTVTSGQVVTLSRKFLDDLLKSDPDSAYTILMNLGRILSERLVASI